ncbi:MAG: GGDEF domain-containing protein [Gammaproteobacteria bacterium]|nr:GGDEF domain-containing protein [Gammaproteobacteria bacterium]
MIEFEEFQNSLIRTIHEASPEGILVVDNYNIIVSHNHKFVEIWRIPDNLLQGSTPGTAIGLDDTPILTLALSRVKHKEAFLARVKELYENPELIDHCEIEFLDGRTIERHSTVLHGNDGKLLERVWFFRDITRQKDTEAQLTALSQQDPLTGIANRRFFFYRAELEFARSKRYSQPLSIALLDIDYFKQINDRYGHAIGDEVLKTVCSLCQMILREVDFLARMGDMEIFARLGGEEFVLLLPSTDVRQALVLAERLRKKVADHEFILEEIKLKCTISIGIAMLNSKDINFQDCLIRADKAMYKAKQDGRNRVEINA